MVRRVVVWLLIATLAGCGGGGSTTTPDSATMAGYRDGLIERSQRIADAVVATNTTCFEGTIEECARALDEQGAVVEEEARWLRDTPVPPGCDALASAYRGVALDAERFFALVGDAVASGEAGRVTLALGEGYPPFIRGLDAANNALIADPCR